jgi:hypothetical protein
VERWLFPGECSDPAKILAAGKLTARAFASAFNDEVRLAQARLFCAHAIEAYWLAIQRPYRDFWELEKTLWASPDELIDGGMRALAAEMGEAAAQLEPVLASYLIGSTYTAMIPEQTRSRLGVYYTPPGLARRLLDMATLAGVDWQTAKAVDPACGGGAFLAPLALKVVAENQHLTARELVRAIADRITGFELDPFAAWTSQVFLESSLMGLCRGAGERLPTPPARRPLPPTSDAGRWSGNRTMQPERPARVARASPRDPLPAPHELHDLQLRSGMQNRLRPDRLLDDFPVVFHRHPGGLQPQFPQQSQDRLALRSQPPLAIHYNLHRHLG